MKAAVLEATGQIAIRDLPTPTPGPGELLVGVEYAGVCGSDLHAFKGEHPFRSPPVVLGHEVSGVIAQVGEGVEGFSVGDRVTVMPYQACGQCLYCRRGRSNVCVDKRVPGIKGWGGTFADAFLSYPAITFSLSDDTSLKRGALAEPLAVGVHSVRQGRVTEGSSVLILGAGTIGLLTAVAAQQAGARAVAITDLLSHNLEVAQALGVATTYRADQEGLVETIRADYPEGFGVVFLTTGAAVTVRQALDLIQRGGRIVATAIFSRPVPLPIIELTLNEVELIGTQIYTSDDFSRALQWLDQGIVPFDRLIDRVLPLEEAQRALEILADPEADAIKVLLQPTHG